MRIHTSIHDCNMAQEIWLDFPDAPGFQGSNTGKARNKTTLQELSVDQRKGTVYVGRKNNGGQMSKTLARLLARVFLPTPPEGHRFIHFRNGNSQDRSSSNMEWSPIRERDRAILRDDYKHKKQQRNLPTGITFRPNERTYKVMVMLKRTKKYESKLFSQSKYGTLEKALVKAKEYLAKMHKDPRVVKPRKKKNDIPLERKDPYGNILPMGLQYRGQVKDGGECYKVQFLHSEICRIFCFSTCGGQKQAFKLAKALWEQHFTHNEELKKQKKFIISLDEHWSIFIRSAARRKMKVSITRARWNYLVKANCLHCGFKPTGPHNLNGIDRIDSSILEYSEKNSAPSCERCNIGKGKRTTVAFQAHLRLILLNHGYSSVSPPVTMASEEVNVIMNAKQDDLAFLETQKRPAKDYLELKKQIKRFRNFINKVIFDGNWEVELNFRQYVSFIAQFCSYCARSPDEVSIGVDRFDPLLHYYFNNCRACCASCNTLKSNLKFEDLITMCIEVLQHYSFTLIPKECVVPLPPAEAIATPLQTPTIIKDDQDDFCHVKCTCNEIL